MIRVCRLRCSPPSCSRRPGARSSSRARRLAERLDTTLDPGPPADAGVRTGRVRQDHRAQRLARPTWSESQTDTRVAWLSLDDGDNDLTRLLTHLVAALQSVGLDVDAGGPRVAATASTTAALTALVNDVARAGAAGAGDAVGPGARRLPRHRRAPEVHEAVTFLLDHLPDQLHLVIATRVRPAAARWRGCAAGASSPSCAPPTSASPPPRRRSSSTRRWGWTSTAADVGRARGAHRGLDRRPAARRPVAARHPEPARGRRLHRGVHRQQPVRPRLPGRRGAGPPAEPRCATSCSAPRSSTGSPARCATPSPGSSDGTAMLADLERGNLFLRPARHPTHLVPLPPPVRRRAARTAAHRAARPGAGSCTSGPATGTPRTASSRTRSGTRWPPRTSTEPPTWWRKRCPSCAARARTACCSAGSRSLPEPVVRRSPVLSILSGWSLMLSGDLDAVGAPARRRRGGTGCRRPRPGPRGHLGGHRRPAHRTGDDPDLPRVAGPGAWRRRRHRPARPARARPGRTRGPPGARRRGRVPRPGRLGGRRRRAGASPRSPRRCAACTPRGTWSTSWTARSVLADMWVAAGPARPRPPALRAGARGRRSRDGEPYPRATADLHVGLAELDRELDDLAGAEATWRRRGSWLSAPPSPRTGTGGPWPWRRCAPPAATTRRRRGCSTRPRRCYRPGFYPDVRPIAAMRARLQIAAGDLAAATGWALDRGVGVDDDPDYLHEYEHLTLARLLLAQQHRTAPTGPRLRPAGHARAPRPAARRGRRRRPRRQPARDPVLQPSPTTPTATARGTGRPGPRPGRDAGAGQPRAAVPGRGRPDAGPAARRRPRATASRRRRCRPVGSSNGPDSRSGRRTAAAAGRPAEPARARGAPAPGQRADRAQIAGELYVSLNTLRTHTKRIFTKLDVRTRAAAVRRARERGVL